MVATSYGIVLDGIEGVLVTLEARTSFDAEPGQMRVIGLPDAAVREGALRARIALSPILQNQVFDLDWGVLVNLAPADLRKVGRTLDLPLAIVYAGLVLGLDARAVREFLFLGEVGLDGSVRAVTGTLAATLVARKCGLKIVCPEDCAREALMVEGLDVFTVRTVVDAIDVVRGRIDARPDARGFEPVASGVPAGIPDLCEVHGQFLARRALEIAAAGAHNLLLEGAPGSGKTMLARRLPGILPPLSDEDALETAVIHGAVRAVDHARFHVPPFRSPHHTATPVGLAGGGSPIRPGELSLAHRGVLFLDEFPEFSRECLEVLREPIEERAIHITRAGRVRRLPAHVLVVAAMNPCPCGFHGLMDGRCSCTPLQVQRYRSRISGPLLDRFDLRVRLRPVGAGELVDSPGGEGSDAVRARVVAAREAQRLRARAIGAVSPNADLADKDVMRVTRLDPAGLAFFRRLVESYRLSARGARRLLRVARTVADLSAAAEVTTLHLAEAASLRMPDASDGTQDAAGTASYVAG